MQIVAVTFLDANYSSYRLKNDNAGKVYFYIDPYGLVRGDIGLVHNGRELSLVKIARVVDASNDEACARVTKPILARVTWHTDKLKGISEKLTEFLARTEEDRIQRAVDIALGLDKPQQAKLTAPSTTPVEPPHLSETNDDEIPF